MKLCVNCRHFTQIGSDSAQCLAAPMPDPVYGRTVYWHCATLRAGHVERDCGPEGRYFEPKQEADDENF